MTVYTKHVLYFDNDFCVWINLLKLTISQAKYDKYGSSTAVKYCYVHRLA